MGLLEAIEDFYAQGGVAGMLGMKPWWEQSPDEIAMGFAMPGHIKLVGAGGTKLGLAGLLDDLTANANANRTVGQRFNRVIDDIIERRAEKTRQREILDVMKQQGEDPVGIVPWLNGRALIGAGKLGSGEPYAVLRANQASGHAYADAWDFVANLAQRFGIKLPPGLVQQIFKSKPPTARPKK